MPYFYPILILQQWQHIFYFSTWDNSPAGKVFIGVFGLMNWNIVPSSESYHGQVWIGTVADGISWISSSELPLIYPSIWPTRTSIIRFVFQLAFVHTIFDIFISISRYFLVFLLDPLAQISGVMTALILYYVRIQSRSVKQICLNREISISMFSVGQPGPLLATSLAGSWRESSPWLQSRFRRSPGWRI